MEATVYSQTGKETGKISLPDEIFGAPWNADLVHEIVRLMNSNSRTNIAHTKTRGEVRGGGKKPWKQKGTGQARHGSTRSPIWVGGGVAHGPRNDQNFSRKINRKAKNKALFAILSKKYKDGEVIFLDQLSFAAPKTKEAKSVLSSLSKIKGCGRLVTKRVNTAIVATEKKDVLVEKSFHNFGNISVEEFRNVNPVSILNHTYIIVTNPVESIKALQAKVK